MASNAHAAAIATTTQLSVPVPSVTVGVPTLLVATVTDASSHSVLQGTVTFYDGSRVLGSAQIVSRAGGSFTQGTANLKTASFTPGANSVTAVFAGTIADLSSTSPAKTVTVTGRSQTATALSARLSGGQYILSAALQAFGAGVPTGSIDLLNLTTDTSLDTVPLSGAAWKNDLVISSMPQVGGQPGGVVAGDFNGDGFPDLATANDDHGISVLIGKGDGTFKPQVSYGAGGFPANIYTGDFNNDGKLDLAVVNYGDGAVGILLGNGDGTFQTQTDYGSVSGAVDAKIADFDRDGNLDFVVTDRYGDDVAVLLGNGDGTFKPQQTYATSIRPWSPVVGDLNGDGIPDLLVTAVFQIGELLGNGDGTFQPMTVLSLVPYGSGPYMTLGDVNGDGKLDLVLGNNQQRTVSVSLGNGDGTFKPTQVYSLDGNPGQPVIIDIDQDGKPDIAITNWINNTIEVLRGNGDGTFQAATVYSTTTEVPDFMIQGDINGDGRPDLVATTSEGSAETVLLNTQVLQIQLPDGPASLAGALVQVSYSGDGAFSPSTSNIVRLWGTSIDFGSGFADSGSTLQLNGSSTVVGSVLELTNGGISTAGSAFAKTPLDIQAFTTDFTFQILNPVADGFTFAIQNAGPGAVGHDGSGLGYSNIPKSLAIKFDLHNNEGEGPNSTGLFTGGALPTILANSLTGTGIDLHSGDSFHAHITYDGVNLTMTLTDTITLANWSYSWTIDIPSAVGGKAAYVGFTGATGAATSTETIAAWTYLAGPPAPNYPVGFDPGDLQFNGFASIGGTELRLTNGFGNEASTAFYTIPQNIQAFTSDFTFQIVNPVGDGLTFVIQNDKLAALGGGGSGLGYSDIPKSVAIKFDIFSNAGEGPDSTGLYINGARPTVPAIDLTGTGIDLHDGDLFKAHMTYDGTNLTMTLTDTVTLAAWSHSWPIDIPATVGGNTAWVGFSGATGSAISAPGIEAWTFVPGTP